MEINCKITYEIPKELIVLLGITEDTSFETYFEGGALHIHPLTDEELAEIESDEDEDDLDCDGICEECEYDECCPYNDDAYEDDENEDEDKNEYIINPDSEARECESCEYYCHRCGCCILTDKPEEND